MRAGCKGIKSALSGVVPDFFFPILSVLLGDERKSDARMQDLEGCHVAEVDRATVHTCNLDVRDKLAFATTPT